MDLLKAQPYKHYSTSDWDFESAHWFLQTGDYISPPSCIWLVPPLADRNLAVLSRLVNAWNVPQGRIITWRSHTASMGIYIIFRAQAPLGVAHRKESYFLSFWTDNCHLYWCDAADATHHIGSTGEGIVMPWTKVKLSWWNGKDLHNAAALAVRLEIYEDNQWRQLGSDIFDPNNRYKDSAINRCGIMARYLTGYLYGEFDDTELWLEVP